MADLGTVIHLIGGTAAGLLTLGMPGLLLINSVIDLRVWVRTGEMSWRGMGRVCVLFMGGCWKMEGRVHACMLRVRTCV